MASIPAVAGLEGRFRARGLRVVGVSQYEAGPVKLVAAAKKHKSTWSSFIDKDAKWMRSAGIRGTPTVLLIGKDGSMLYRWRGKLLANTPAHAALTKAIEKALGG